MLLSRISLILTLTSIDFSILSRYIFEYTIDICPDGGMVDVRPQGAIPQRASLHEVGRHSNGVHEKIQIDQD